MGPKKGKGKAGPVDGVDTTSMSREQLEAFSLRLKEELDREREERNFFQLERDKLRTFWEITRQQLEENRAQLRNQDRAHDEYEEKHQAEIKVYKQKVKHLLYEHQCNLSDLKVESMVSLKMAQDEYTAMEQELLQDKKELKAKLREQELAHQEEMRQLKMEHSAEVSRLREQFSQDANELERKYEARMASQNEELGMQHSMEIGEVEQRKNRQVVELTKSHEQAFNDMKNYYNDITLNNLALISSLKEQMEELKSGHERMEKQLRDVQGENKRLVEPLKQARAELANLQKQLSNYEQDKIALTNTKQRLALITKEFEDLRWENEVLQLRFEKVEKERNRLHADFVGAVLDVQQKTGLKSAVLEKKMTEMRGGAVSDQRRFGRRRPLWTPPHHHFGSRIPARSVNRGITRVRFTRTNPELLHKIQVALNRPVHPSITHPRPPKSKSFTTSKKEQVEKWIARSFNIESGSTDESSCSCVDVLKSVSCADLYAKSEVSSGMRVEKLQDSKSQLHLNKSQSHQDSRAKHLCKHKCKKCRNIYKKQPSNLAFPPNKFKNVGGWMSESSMNPPEERGSELSPIESGQSSPESASQPIFIQRRSHLESDADEFNLKYPSSIWKPRPSRKHHVGSYKYKVLRSSAVRRSDLLPFQHKWRGTIAPIPSTNLHQIGDKHAPDGISYISSGVNTMPISLESSFHRVSFTSDEMKIDDYKGGLLLAGENVCKLSLDVNESLFKETYMEHQPVEELGESHRRKYSTVTLIINDRNHQRQSNSEFLTSDGALKINRSEINEPSLTSQTQEIALLPVPEISNLDHLCTVKHKKKSVVVTRSEDEPVHSFSKLSVQKQNANKVQPSLQLQGLEQYSLAECKPQVCRTAACEEAALDNRSVIFTERLNVGVNVPNAVFNRIQQEELHSLLPENQGVDCPQIAPQIHHIGKKEVAQTCYDSIQRVHKTSLNTTQHKLHNYNLLKYERPQTGPCSTIKQESDEARLSTLVHDLCVGLEHLVPISKNVENIPLARPASRVSNQTFSASHKSEISLGTNKVKKYKIKAHFSGIVPSGQSEIIPNAPEFPFQQKAVRKKSCCSSSQSIISELNRSARGIRAVHSSPVSAISVNPIKTKIDRDWDAVKCVTALVPGQVKSSCHVEYHRVNSDPGRQSRVVEGSLFQPSFMHIVPCDVQFKPKVQLKEANVEKAFVIEGKVEPTPISTEVLGCFEKAELSRDIPTSTGAFLSTRAIDIGTKSASVHSLRKEQVTGPLDIVQSKSIVTSVQRSTCMPIMKPEQGSFTRDAVHSRGIVTPSVAVISEEETSSVVLPESQISETVAIVPSTIMSDQKPASPEKPEEQSTSTLAKKPSAVAVPADLEAAKNVSCVELAPLRALPLRHGIPKRAPAAKEIPPHTSSPSSTSTARAVTSPKPAYRDSCAKSPAVGHIARDLPPRSGNTANALSSNPPVTHRSRPRSAEGWPPGRLGQDRKPRQPNSKSLGRTPVSRVTPDRTPEPSDPPVDLSSKDQSVQCCLERKRESDDSSSSSNKSDARTAVLQTSSAQYIAAPSQLRSRFGRGGKVVQLSMPTSTSDLPRNRSRRKDRHGRESPVQDHRKTVARPSCLKVPSCEASRDKLAVRSRRQSQLSVHFDPSSVEIDLAPVRSKTRKPSPGECDSDSNSSRGSSDGEGSRRRRSSPSPPRSATHVPVTRSKSDTTRIGLKNASKREQGKRSRSRSEIRPDSPYPSYSHLLLGERKSSSGRLLKQGWDPHDRHAQCYQDKVFFPPIPVRSTSRTRASSGTSSPSPRRGLSPARAIPPIPVRSTSRTRTRASSGTSSPSPRRALSPSRTIYSGASSSSEKPAPPPIRRRVPLRPKMKCVAGRLCRDEKVPTKTSKLASRPQRKASSSPERQEVKRRPRKVRSVHKDVSKSTAVPKSRSRSPSTSDMSPSKSVVWTKWKASAVDTKPVIWTKPKANAVEAEVVEPENSMWLRFPSIVLACKERMSGREVVKEPESTPPELDRPSSHSTGDKSPTPLTPHVSSPEVTFPNADFRRSSSSSHIFWKRDKNVVTIQEIFSDDALFHDDSALSRLGYLLEEAESDIRLDFINRLGCLSEETDSDLKLDNPDVTSAATSELARVQKRGGEDSKTLQPPLAPSPGLGAVPKRKGGKALENDSDDTPRATTSRPLADVKQALGKEKSAAGLSCLRADSAAPRDGSSNSSRTPKVRFSDGGNSATSASDADAHEKKTWGELQGAIQANLQRLRDSFTEVQSKSPAAAAAVAAASRSMESVKMAAPSTVCSPSEDVLGKNRVVDSPEETEVRQVRASGARTPTKILVSRAKSTASLTGIHERPTPRAVSPSESMSKILRPSQAGKDVMVVELYQKTSGSRGLRAHRTSSQSDDSSSY